MLTFFYTAFLYQPLLNLLVLFYTFTPFHDVGVSILLLTIFIRLLLFPLTFRALKHQQALQSLGPKMEAIKQQFRDDKQKQSVALMELYKTEKVNPLSSCLPVLIQLPFLIAVYRVLQTGLTTQDFSLLYPFVPHPSAINTISFGIIDWSRSKAPATLVLSILAGVAQFMQTKMLFRSAPLKTASGKQIPGAKDEALTAALNKQMLYFMPLLTVFIGYSLPAGLAWYWLITTIFTLLQQWYVMKRQKPVLHEQKVLPTP